MKRKAWTFAPLNGESPRQVQSRIQHWLNKIIIENRDTGAFVHKGIIRCIYAMAFDWDMRGESPIAFNWEHAHTFELDPRGRLKDLHSSISLTAER